MSEILGNRSALAAPIRAVAAATSFRLKISGRRWSSSEGRPAEFPGACLLRQRPPAGNREGFSTEQDAQLIFRLNHLPFEFGGPCRGIGPLRFKLIGIQS